MAVDEAMLDAVGRGDAPPVLRLYRWSEPTLSLGYFQAFADVARQGPAVRALPVVRRTTGGGAILHADELTYALVVGCQTGHSQDASQLYECMHAVITAGVEALAGRRGVVTSADAHDQAGESASTTGRGKPFFCFARRSRYDLLAGADKLAGSAQRRTRRAVLQHGSVILRRSFPAQHSSSLADIAGREVSFDEMADAVVSVLGQAGMKLTPGSLTPA